LSSSDGASRPRFDREIDVCAQQVRPRMCQLAHRTGIGHRDQPQPGVRHAGLMLGLRCGKQPSPAANRVAGQLGRAFEERRGRGRASPRLGASRTVLQLRGNVLTDTANGLCPLPRSPIRVGDRVGDLSQRPVRPARSAAVAAR
jgi:hypothetical protein